MIKKYLALIGSSFRNKTYKSRSSKKLHLLVVEILISLQIRHNKTKCDSLVNYRSNVIENVYIHIVIYKLEYLDVKTYYSNSGLYCLIRFQICEKRDIDFFANIRMKQMPC